MFKEREEGTIEELEAMVTSLGEVVESIDPILKKSIEEKARLAGYNQALEQVFNLIAAKRKHIQKQVEERKEELIQKVDVKLELPKIDNLVKETQQVVEKEIKESVIVKEEVKEPPVIKEVKKEAVITEQPKITAVKEEVEKAPVKRLVNKNAYNNMIPL